MKKLIYLAVMCVMAAGSVAWADTFGSGANAFNIDFVSISGNASSANGTFIGDNKPEGFSDPGNYRMGTKEITNAQFAKFASNSNVCWTGDDVPSNEVSWFEAAQFVNWLNTSSGKSAAYKFTGSTFAVWDVTDTGYDASNPFRNSNAKYFMPTENEWVKAAYWNGSVLQTYATKSGESLYQGNGSNGGWNYDCYTMQQPWNVGSGSQELNDTYDMMGNVWELMESPYYTGDYLSGSDRGVRGGSYLSSIVGPLTSSYRYGVNPLYEGINVGFRVASIVPEPASLVLLGLGGLAVMRRRK